MTPARLGISCCPGVNLKECLDSNNISMISCGGQASIPICHAIKKTNEKLDYIEVVSTISSASAGPGTRRNISEYITSTQQAISRILGIKKVKVIINITPATPPIHMKTTILMRSEDILDELATERAIKASIISTKNYIPGYKSSVTLKN